MFRIINKLESTPRDVDFIIAACWVDFLDYGLQCKNPTRVDTHTYLLMYA